MTASAPETFIVLKKNQALDDRSDLAEKKKESDAQVLNDPLHDAEVIHHLHKGDEEDDGTQNTSKKPVLVDDGLPVEEEDGANFGLIQEVGGEEGDPSENLETSVGLEDEEGDGLLEEETNDDRRPAKDQTSFQQSNRNDRNYRSEIDPPWDQRTVVGGQPEAKLENEEAKDGDGTIAVRRSLCHTNVRNTISTVSRAN